MSEITEERLLYLYDRLVEQSGAANVYILSAGWGFIGSTFPTPDYDITFSSSAHSYKHRRKSDPCRDFFCEGAVAAVAWNGSPGV
jgi:hypothetical protein